MEEVLKEVVVQLWMLMAIVLVFEFNVIYFKIYIDIIILKKINVYKINVLIELF